MPLEVEKRSHLKNDEEYKKCKDWLDNKAKLFESSGIVTYLFQKPTYLRIRYKENSEELVLTHKSGNYHDPARKETEVTMKRDQLSQLIELLKSLDYRRAAYMDSQSMSYKYKEFRVDLTTYDYLGHIVEVELLTEDKSKVIELERSVLKVLHEMDLQELDADVYQKMLDKMYKKAEKEI